MGISLEPVAGSREPDGERRRGDRGVPTVHSARDTRGSAPPARGLRVAIALGAALALTVAVAPGARPGNVVTNAGFELDCGGVPCGWRDLGTSATVARDAAAARTGDAGLTLTGSAGRRSAAVISACFQVTGGEEYMQSFWFRTTNGDVSLVDQRVSFYENANCAGVESTDVFSTWPAPPTDGQWRPVWATGTVRPTWRSAETTVVFFCTVCAGTSVQFDDVGVGLEAQPALPVAPSPGWRLDQAQPFDINSGRGLAVGGASDQKIAQVVTAGRPGFLRQLRAPLGCTQISELHLDVHRVPAQDESQLTLGPRVGSAVISGVTVRRRFPEVWFQPLSLSPAVFFAASQRFAIVLSADAVGCQLFGLPSGNPYGGGDALFDAAPNTRGVWLPLGTDADVAFQTYVEPACVVPRVRGLPVSAARATLVRFGCSAGAIRKIRSRARKGRVLSSSPGAGAQLVAASRVALTVSAGQPKRKKKPARR
jgi:hypothetical protein